MRTIKPNNPITKTVMEQYEKVRASGKCDMLDFYCVQRTADERKLYELACLDVREYVKILEGYSKLMTFYNIKRGG